MLEDNGQMTIYREYMVSKRDHLLSVMDNLMRRMRTERCSIRHFKQWEAEMQGFKDEYRIFRKNIVHWLNESRMDDLEMLVEPYCEEIEEHYEILAQLFLEKQEEIRENTTYFETRHTPRRQQHFWTLPGKHLNIHIFLIKLRRK